MRSRLNGFYIICGIYFLLDIYTYFGLKSLFAKSASLRIYQVVYILSSLFIYFSFYKVYLAFTGGKFFSSASANIYLGFVFTAIVSKLVFSVFLLPQDAIRLLMGVGTFFKQLVTGQSPVPDTPYFPERRRMLTLGATVLAAIPFSTMLYGITKGKYRYTVNNVKLAFKDLPAAFEGFKIVQISDIHAGSFDSKAGVEKGVNMVNAQNPDIIVFTGDMVNSSKDEVNPYIDIFNKLSAKHGKFACLGNHDYYGVPRNAPQKEVSDYWADFYKKFEQMGFQLLNNEHAKIEKNGERICVLGVENWGAGRWFPKRGDIDQCLKNVADDDFCMLLSHDPTHWDEKVIPHSKNIHLTFSGHTHGFQFGLNLPGFKWSPAQYRYPRWMGLYKEAGQYLYVNRGFGFLSFPGRVGMWPEITVVELTKDA